MMPGQLSKSALCFTGHRPDKLGHSRQEEDELRLRLHQRIIQAISEGFTQFYCGMAMGTDIIAGELVVSLRQQYPELRLIAVVPFPQQSRSWPMSWRVRWTCLIRQADQQVVLYPDYCRGCYHARNRYMVNHVQRVIAVYDGSPGGTATTIQYARQKGVPVEIVAPQIISKRP